MTRTTSSADTKSGVVQVLYLPSSAEHLSLNQLVDDVLASLDKDVSVHVVHDAHSAIEYLDRDHFDIIVVSHSGKQSEAVSSLDIGLALASDYPVIVLTDEDDETITQSILADGAVECLAINQLQSGQLDRAMRRALARHKSLNKRRPVTRNMHAKPTSPGSVPGVTSRDPNVSAAPAPIVAPVHADALRRSNPSGILIGAALLVAVALLAHRSWNTFLRYQAYGVVVGRAIDVSAPWEGQIKYVHVEEGQAVRQDDLLITIENLALRRTLEELDDELAVANAELNSKVSELKWNASYYHDVNARTSSTYFETWGQLLNEREMVTKLRLAYERAQELVAMKAITQDDFDEIKYNLRGHIHKVEKLTRAVNELKSQVESAQGLSELGSDQLSPLYARILAIKAKRERLRSQIEEGQLRSPVNGTVLRRNRFAGERCDAGKPIMTVVEETSARIIVYYPQKSSCIPEVGDGVTLHLPPDAHALECIVERVGDSFEPPPAQIARHYLADEKLLPVRMKPDSSSHQSPLRLGAVVMLPRSPSLFSISTP